MPVYRVTTATKTIPTSWVKDGTINFIVVTCDCTLLWPASKVGQQARIYVEGAYTIVLHVPDTTQIVLYGTALTAGNRISSMGNPDAGLWAIQDKANMLKIKDPSDLWFDAGA